MIGKILCLFGRHDWGGQRNVRGGYGGNHPLGALIGLVTNPRLCDRTCLRCGKTKEFIYDSER